MTKAWFIVPITGDGKSTQTAFAATTTSEVSCYVAIIATNQSGAPIFTWALMQASGASFTNLAALAGVFQLPVPSTALFSSLTAAQQQAVTQGCSNYSIPVSPNATETITHVLNRIGQTQEPTFDATKFLVGPNAVP